MAKRFDRTSIFLVVLGLLFLWDLALVLGIGDLKRFPHPFRVFFLLGDSDFLRGFLRMIRLMIMCSVSGGLIGMGLALLIIRSSWLTQTMLRFLRLGSWLPVLVIFAIPAQGFLLIIAAAMLCSCYHYLGMRERVLLLGGTWAIGGQSKKKGTKVTVTIPLEKVSSKQ